MKVRLAYRRTANARPAGIQAVYDNNPAEYQSLIGDTLQKVANEVDRIINPSEDNVVAIRGPARGRRTRPQA